MGVERSLPTERLNARNSSVITQQTVWLPTSSGRGCEASVNTRCHGPSRRARAPARPHPEGVTSYGDHTGPLAIAHRGGMALAPENTLAAFRLGVYVHAQGDREGAHRHLAELRVHD